MNVHQVFISSVMRGYGDRRQVARQTIKELGMAPVLAEDLPAGPNPPRDVVFEALKRSDAVVGIYGNRYGWTESKSGLSPTEEEYNWAQENSIPVFAFIDRMEPGEPEPRQKQFLARVQHWDVGVTRNEFHSPSELRKKIKDALSGEARSPRYQRFLNMLPLNARKLGFEPTPDVPQPALDLVLLRQPKTQFDPIWLMGVVDGDLFDRRSTLELVKTWDGVIAEYFRTGAFRGRLSKSTLVIAVERNPHGYAPPALRRGRSTEYLADLAARKAYAYPEGLLTRPWALDDVLKMLEQTVAQVG